MPEHQLDEPRADNTTTSLPTASGEPGRTKVTGKDVRSFLARGRELDRLKIKLRTLMGDKYVLLGEDALQDVAVYALEHHDDIGKSLHSWLRRVAHSKGYDHLRRWRRTVKRTSAAEVASLDLADDHDVETVVGLARAAHMLPLAREKMGEERWAVFEAVDGQGLTRSEADPTELSPGRGAGRIRGADGSSRGPAGPVRHGH